MKATPALTTCRITARLYGGTYLARVDGSAIQASCTASIEEAARRAGGKALRVTPDRVILTAIPTTQFNRACFTASIEGA